jgi:hypothetical protein
LLLLWAAAGGCQLDAFGVPMKPSSATGQRFLDAALSVVC